MASKARSPARPGSAGSQVIVRNEGEGAGGRRGYYSYSPAPYGRDWDLELGGRDRPLPRRSGLGRVFGRGCREGAGQVVVQASRAEGEAAPGEARPIVYEA